MMSPPQLIECYNLLSGAMLRHGARNTLNGDYLLFDILRLRCIEMLAWLTTWSVDLLSPRWLCETIEMVETIDRSVQIVVQNPWFAIHHPFVNTALFGARLYFQCTLCADKQSMEKKNFDWMANFLWIKFVSNCCSLRSKPSIEISKKPVSSLPLFKRPSVILNFDLKNDMKCWSKSNENIWNTYLFWIFCCNCWKSDRPHTCSYNTKYILLYCQ